jgi:hypothetical protein
MNSNLVELPIFAGLPVSLPLMRAIVNTAPQSLKEAQSSEWKDGPGQCAGPCFVLGGTVYKDYKGTVPAVGVEVRVVDMQGNSASCHTGANGNFRIDADAGVTLPAIVGARDGTTTRPMVTTLANGMCGTSGCHTPMGSPSAGDYYPIHVP